MKEYKIIYIGFEDGREQEFIGSGHGTNGQEAVRDFLLWHDDCIRILTVRFEREYGAA